MNVDETDAGVYTCFVYNGVKTYCSTPSTLHVIGIGKYTIYFQCKKISDLFCMSFIESSNMRSAVHLSLFSTQVQNKFVKF